MAGKLTDDQLRTFLESGRSQAEASRYFGISESAVSQRLRRLNGRTARILALEHAGTVVEQKLDGAQRLERVQQVIDQELSWAVAHVSAGTPTVQIW
jgi:DNA-binding transcriptional LysR family regulator